jgi:hypothetical protein
LAGILNLPVVPQLFEYGSLFESLIINEIHRRFLYSGKSFQLSYFRVDDNIEINFIVEQAGQPTYMVEIKSTTYANTSHTDHLNRYSKGFPNIVQILSSLDKTRKEIGEALCLSWYEAWTELGLRF